MRQAIPIVLLAATLASCHAFKSKPKTPTTGLRVAILDYETRAKVEPELKSLTVVLPPPVVNADWPQPGGSRGEERRPPRAARHAQSVAWHAKIGKGSAPASAG